MKSKVKISGVVEMKLDFQMMNSFMKSVNSPSCIKALKKPKQ